MEKELVKRTPDIKMEELLKRTPDIKMEELLKRTPDIEMMVPYWNTVYAILEGKDVIQAGGTEFLPQFPNEITSDYDFRLKTGKFTNIYRDVVEGLSSKPFQDEISLIGQDKPVALVEFIEDVDGLGSNMTTFASLTFFNGINYAIDWIFVDYPIIENSENITIAQAKEKNIKPYWRHVLGKNVLEVKTKMVGSKEIITYFRYQEPSFMNQPIRVREYKENTETGKVDWKLYEESVNKEKQKIFVVIEKGTLSIGIIPVTPFITGRRDGNSFKFHPPMKDTADLQITLYQNESALEYIKVLACYPMLATDGVRTSKTAGGEPERVAIGPGRVLYGVALQNGTGGTWKYVEPNANSLEFLQKNIDKTKNDLRELGRQPLTALSTQLTNITTSIAAGKAKSAVTAWALSLKDALENALAITMIWMGETYEPEVNVYTGFDDVLDNGSDVEALSKARERGDISVETFWEECKRRKILSPEFTTEREKQRLLDEIPSSTLDGYEETKFNNIKE